MILILKLPVRISSLQHSCRILGLHVPYPFLKLQILRHWYDTSIGQVDPVVHHDYSTVSGPQRNKLGPRGDRSSAERSPKFGKRTLTSISWSFRETDREGESPESRRNKRNRLRFMSIFVCVCVCVRESECVCDTYVLISPVCPLLSPLFFLPLPLPLPSLSLLDDSLLLFSPGMQYGTVRVLYLHLCSQFTALLHVQ